MTELRQAETLEQPKKLKIHERIRLNKADNHFGFYNFCVVWSYHKKEPKGHNVQDGWFGDTFCLGLHACTAYCTSGTQLKVTVPLAGNEVQTQEVTGSGHGRLSSIDANLQAEKSRQQRRHFKSALTKLNLYCFTQNTIPLTVLLGQLRPQSRKKKNSAAKGPCLIYRGPNGKFLMFTQTQPLIIYWNSFKLYD